ncbi:MAG: hypothetical protein IJY88_05455 [Clostridia bacterium]|nr:hypothetical protein [Clostridia bacterium]
MPKIIFTSRYTRNPKASNSGKLLRYMATRESVEKVAVGLDRSPSTVRQQRLIKNILEAYPETKDYLEYEDYLKEPCKSNATEFIDAVIDRNIDRLDGVKNLVKYYAERPGVAKLGTHGLFSQTDDKIDLDKVAEEVSNHKGIIWTHVISLRREDAERLRYNNPSRWRDLIRSIVAEIADAHNIDLENLRWYAAFHNKDHHPHVHLMVYSADAKQGWITKRSIDDMRSMFGNEIFRGEQYRLFEMQTKQRELVKEKFKERIKHFEENGYTLTPQLEFLFFNLAKQLKSVKGKKVYGYLPKDIKDTVDSIVRELAKDKDIADLYHKWNEINREKLSLYHEKKTPDIPLEDNKEFRSIKNIIVKAAVEFNNTQYSENYTPQNYTASAFGRILCQLIRAISQSYDNRDRKLRSQVDGKLRSKIAQKKAALGIRPEQSDYENYYEQSM